jgi:hypothetical protein
MDSPIEGIIGLGSWDGTPVLANEMNPRVLRNFEKSFKNATEVKWTVRNDGFRVHFYQDGIQHRAFYNKRGQWEATLRYCGEASLPSDVRHLVRSNYYDFRIVTVIEVTKDQKTAYIINLEDQTSLKIIKVVDGEIETVQDCVKG